MITAAPFTNRQTGEVQLQIIKTCLYHTIQIATWKMIERLKHEELERAKQRRIVTV